MDNVKPKKHLGQHFLIDENISRKIAALIPPDPSSIIVEIGPGKGVLTKHLLGKFKKVVVVEFDTESVEYLQHHYPNELEIHSGDFLKWPITEPANFIGNLPYNISSPIFFRLLENYSLVKAGAFMIQKEVAERITAKPGGKEYGILSVLLTHYFDVKYEFTVSEKVFFPRPRVLSAVISLKPKPNVPDLDFKKLKLVVKQGFGQRRKTLRNALRGLKFSSGEVEKFMDKRAEQLTGEDFIFLANNLEAIESDDK